MHHGPKKDKGSLRLDSLEAAKKGGDEGQAIIPGNIEDSLLIERIALPADHDDIMPPKGDPLNKAQVKLLSQWIKNGAQWPEEARLMDRSVIVKAGKLPELKQIKDDLNLEKISC